MKIAAILLIQICALSAGEWRPSSAADPNKPLLFEVVSVHVHPGPSESRPLISDKWTPEGYFAEGISLPLLVAKAYGVRLDTVQGGPGWVHEKTFDISAKVAPDDISNLGALDIRQKNALLRQILESRFSLRCHQETKTVPIFQLVLANGGPRSSLGLRPSTDTPTEQAAKRRIGVSNSQMSATDVPISQLVSILWGIVGRPVIDGTGMTGVFSFDLKWTPDDKLMAAGSQEANPGIFTAIKEQLGLELRPAKGPVDTLVIDNAILPTAN